MPDRWSDYASLFVTALELEHTVYQIDRRWWEQQEVFHVLDADDARITAELVNMVASSELQPNAGGGRFEVLN
jgi:hypothetical protein